MEYKATFGIDGGISHGLGLKELDYYERYDKIIADSNEEAMMKVFDRTKYYTYESLSNPKTGYTAVKLLSLVDNNGKYLDQSSLVNLVNEKVDFEDGKLVFKRSPSEIIEYILNHPLD